MDEDRGGGRGVFRGGSAPVGDVFEAEPNPASWAAAPWAGSVGRPASETFVPHHLLEGAPNASDRHELAAEIHAHLRLLASLEAGMDLALGAGLARVDREFGVESFGCSSGRDLAPALYGFSWGHARELMLLADKLASLPRLRAAFLSATLSRSKVRELVRVATEDDEAGWFALGKRHSVRELKDVIADWRAGSMDATARHSVGAGRALPAVELDSADDDDPDGHVRVSFRASEAEAAIWSGWGRAMLATVLGKDVPDWQLAEALAAETLADLGPEWDDGQAPAGGACTTRSRRERKRRRFRAKDLLRLARKSRRLATIHPFVRLPDPTAARTAAELHAVLFEIVALRNALEWERGQLLDLLHARCLYRELGFRTFDEYLLRALGLSAREGFGAVKLQRQLDPLPHVAQAFREGRLPPRAAALLVKVARPDTERAWLGHAFAVSWKRLLVEVSWHLAFRGVAEDRYERATGGLPQPHVPTRRLLLDWREMFGCREAERRARGQRKGGVCTAPDDDVADDAATPTRRFERTRSVSFWAPESVARLWTSALRRAHAETGWTLDDGECVHWMLIRFAHAHAGPEIARHLRHHAVLERDGWTCQMPHCGSLASFHEHHVRFRSHGGSDDDENLVTLCAACHHRLVHEGFALVEGTAPDELTVTLGTRPGCPRSTWRGGIRVA